MRRYSTIVTLSMAATITSAFAISGRHVLMNMEGDPRTVSTESNLPPSTEIWKASYHSGKGSRSGIILWRTGNQVTVALQRKERWESTVLEGPEAFNLWSNIESRTRKMAFIPKDAKIYRIRDAALGWCVRQYKTAANQMSANEYNKYLRSVPKIEGCLSEDGNRELTAIFESIQGELGVPVPSDK